MDCSPPGSSVHGILQARTLECVAIPFSTTNVRVEIKCSAWCQVHGKQQLVLLGLFRWNPGLCHGHRYPQTDLIAWGSLSGPLSLVLGILAMLGAGSL